jgi:hypothetical protein
LGLPGQTTVREEPAVFMGVHREMSEGGRSGAIRRSRVLLRWFMGPDGAAGQPKVWEIGRSCK